MQKINLFTSHFIQEDKERQKELDFCYEANKNSGLFNNVFNFSDRPKYNDFFEATKNYPNDINVFANADIYFNESINLVREMKDNDCYALTRSEIKDGEIVPFEVMHTENKEAKAKHSQDVWVVKGAARHVNGDFYIGVPGCDNRIAAEISRSGYDLSNPSDKIICIHKHNEIEREYTIKYRIPPPYLWVEQGGGIEKPGTKRRVRI